ncbi:hypothetical protein GGX14DRAFT_350640 [Mycena pura]|uniref:Integrase core domain-containing protein n=1 Tax=Mycena pura TaxID=153505 RepID=A0AAD6YND1_9AGAR|nr:hypothetical protein GGX14DRAFT_350640 [Mycena pura]
MDNLPRFAQETLLNAFREHYHHFVERVDEVVGSRSDPTVIARLGDDLDEFAAIVAASHHGRPVLVHTVHTGARGRPRIHIDHNFLRWAYGQRSTAGIYRYLGVGRNTVRNTLLDAGIAEPQANPFPPSGDPALDEFITSQPTLDTEVISPVADITDNDLDSLLIRLRTHFRRAGISMLNGMLRRLGYRVPIERIRSSLLRIDPVRQIFEWIRIRRRQYSVLGPNSLWLHDGQHGQSVHNIRIERLWVDVTAQVTATWSDHFITLELRYGLDSNNPAHIWLLHFLFLSTINSQLEFFAESWNQHRIQIRNGPNRSPTDMFVNGVRGDQLPPEEENLSQEELEVYGIDWQGLRDENILHLQSLNNSCSEEASSWIGETTAPPNLSEVTVEPLTATLPDQVQAALTEHFSGLFGSAETADIITLWTQSLAFVRSLYPDVF